MTRASSPPRGGGDARGTRVPAPRTGDGDDGDAGDEQDRRWMRRALRLARRGRGSTRPNPMVGAVVVRGGRAIGEGFHRKVGEAHAEVNALAGLGPRRTAGATVYVTLEPCSHVGRTSPCTDALIAAGVARVVVAVSDPNPLVDGRGIARLRRAGVRVDVGCLKDDAYALNRPFFAWVRDRRPLVTLKVAATLDGFIAPPGPRARREPVWITGRAAREAAHALRAEHDAILVGAATVAADDPRLTVRLPAARVAGVPPLRVVLDGRLRIDANAAVLRGPRAARTLVVGAAGGGAGDAARARALEAAGAEVIRLPARAGKIEIGRVLRELAARDVQSLLVEGGAAVHAAFIDAGLVDRVAFFYAPRLMGGGVPIASGQGRRSVGRGGANATALGLSLGPLAVKRVGSDLLITADVIR